MLSVYAFADYNPVGDAAMLRIARIVLTVLFVAAAPVALGAWGCVTTIPCGICG